MQISMRRTFSEMRRCSGGVDALRVHGDTTVREDATDDLVAVDALRLGLEAQRDAVAKHVRRERLDVLRHDVAATLQEGPAARGERERDGPARRGAGAHEAR